MNTKVFHMSIQGFSHIKNDKICQDDSISYQDEDMSIAIVCDGHGGDDYVRSDIGSTLAATVALESIKQFAHTMCVDDLFKDKDTILQQLKSSIIANWRNAVEEHAKNHPFGQEELEKISEKAKKKYANGRVHSAYGTTLIAVLITKEYWIGLQIGDGRCVAINPAGEFKQPVPVDDKCFLNATTSICDSDAINSFHHFCSRKLPIAVFVGTDGVEDSFKNDDQLHHLYRAICYGFVTTDFEKAKNDLYAYLPNLSKKGSGDDISISAILNIKALETAEIVTTFNVEKEKARIAENARIEAEKYAIEKAHHNVEKENNESNNTFVKLLARRKVYGHHISFYKNEKKTRSARKEQIIKCLKSSYGKDRLANDRIDNGKIELSVFGITIVCEKY